MVRLRQACAFALTAIASASHAADVRPTTLLGAGAWSHPVYLGSEYTVVDAFPVIRYYGDTLFARTTQGILEAGAKYAPLTDFTVGAQLAWEGGRDSATADFLERNKVASLPISFSWGLHAEWDTNLGPAPFNVLARYRQDVQSARGAQTDLRASLGFYGGKRLKAGVFAQGIWANAASNQTWYGNLAGANSLAPFTADTGNVSQSLGLLWSYAPSKHWSLQGSLEQRRLASALSPSPLVQATRHGYLSIGFACPY